MSMNEDDKPTVVLDLNALKKQKLKQEEDLANIGTDLEFNTPDSEIEHAYSAPTSISSPTITSPQSTSSVKKKTFKVILFDFQSDFFKNSKSSFPKDFDYVVATNLQELNKFLGAKEFQIAVFNYDVNPKAVNQLTTQIKQKFPRTKTMIMAKAISPEKAKIHAKTAGGANGYYQFPLDAKKIETEFLKIQNESK